MSPKRTEEQLAKDLYMQTDLTQQQIADMLDVNRRSVWLWIKNGKWEEMKLAAQQAPCMILQDIYNHISAINNKIREREDDHCPTMEEVEKLRKLIGMTNSIQKRHTGSYIQAYADLLGYVSKIDKYDVVEKITTHANNFVKGTIFNKFFQLKKERNRNVNEVIDNLNKLDKTSIPCPPETLPDEPITPVRKNSGSAPTNMPHTSNTPSGASFKPINQTPDCVTPPSPSERAGVRPCDNNASKCDNNVSIPTPAVSSNVSQKPAAGLPHVETTNASHPTHYHTSDFLENVTTSRDAASPSPSERAGERSETELEKMIKLPPEKRTSPFRIGNILWVNNIDDVDERYDNLGKEWGERKMGDIIRRYSTYGQ